MGRPKKEKPEQATFFTKIDKQLKKKLDHYLIDKDLTIGEWLEQIIRRLKNG